MTYNVFSGTLNPTHFTSACTAFGIAELQLNITHWMDTSVNPPALYSVLLDEQADAECG